MNGARHHIVVGWTLVAVQAVLLAVIVVLPARGDWRVPWWLHVVAAALVAAGLAVTVWSARSLGSALTATPEPRAGERLRTAGPYARVRHPIYSGVLLAVVGLVLRSGSVITVAVGISTVVFFNAKAAWEERRLAARHPDYRAYADRTGRFFPRRRR